MIKFGKEEKDYASSKGETEEIGSQVRESFMGQRDTEADKNMIRTDIKEVCHLGHCSDNSG